MGQIIPAFSRETREAIHAHGVRSDPRRYGPPTGCSHFFQSMIPEWGATRKAIQGTMRAIISIHAPRVGSDRATAAPSGAAFDFYPRSPRGERRSLSGLPARAGKISIHAPRVGSDCLGGGAHPWPDISIHAPRVGSDPYWATRARDAQLFLSTLPAWGATIDAQLLSYALMISIHAPRVGSDR